LLTGVMSACAHGFRRSVRRVNFYSNLPGTPPFKVPVGAAVEVTRSRRWPGPAHPRVAGRRIVVKIRQMMPSLGADFPCSRLRC
jgi:hypothetical protein